MSPRTTRILNRALLCLGLCLMALGLYSRRVTAYADASIWILLTGLGVCLISEAWERRILRQENARKPVVYASATVIGRRTRVRIGVRARGHTEHFLTFQPDGRPARTFRVTEALYVACREGKRGTLVYQGRALIEFDGMK